MKQTEHTPSCNEPAATSDHSPADINAGSAPDHVRINPGDVTHGEIEIVRERDAWSNKVARLVLSIVRLPAHDGGQPEEQEEVSLSHAPGQDDGVVVAPVDDDDRIILVRQFRHPVRMWVRELPRGGRSVGESVRDCAARELREELGLTLTECHALGRMATDSGQQEGVPHLIVARVRPGSAPEREAGEIIDRTFRYRYSELRASCERGEIIDSFTLAAVLRLGPHYQNDRFAYDRERAPARAL